MTDAEGNSEFRFPSSSALKVSEKQNLLCRLGPVIKCLFLFVIFRTPMRYQAVFRYEIPSKKSLDNPRKVFHSRFNAFSIFSVLNKAVIKRPFLLDKV